MPRIFRIFFSIFILNFLSIAPNIAAVSSNLQAHKIFVEDPKSNEQQFKILKRMARLENVLEEKKKSNWWKYIFWPLVIAGVIVGVRFLFANQDAMTISTGYFYLGWFLSIVLVGIILQLLYDWLRRRLG